MKLLLYIVAVSSALPLAAGSHKTSKSSSDDGTKHIELVANPLSEGKGKLCQCDCDFHTDCKDSLRCYHRKRGDFKSVPGCLGGEDDGSRTDYCVEAFAEISSTSESHCIGQSIEVCFDYSFPLKNDRIAVYRAGETSPLPFPSLLWAYAFSKTHLLNTTDPSYEEEQGRISYGCVTFDSSEFVDAGTSSSWPLEPGTYEAWITHNLGVEGIVSSPSFTVKDCPPTTAPSNAPTEVPTLNPTLNRVFGK